MAIERKGKEKRDLRGNRKMNERFIYHNTSTARVARWCAKNANYLQLFIIEQRRP